MYNYHCFNAEDREHCNQCDSKGGVKSSEKRDDFICPRNHSLLKLMGESVAGGIAPKMTREQIKADRTKRSRKHFQEHVLPTITDVDARRHHLKKQGYKS